MADRVEIPRIEGFVNRAYRWTRQNQATDVSRMEVEIRSLARIAGVPETPFRSLPGRAARTKAFGEDVFLHADDGGTFEPNASTFNMNVAIRIVGSRSRFCLPSPEETSIGAVEDGRPSASETGGAGRPVFVQVDGKNFAVCLDDPLSVVAGALRLLQRSERPETMRQVETLAPLVEAMCTTSWTARARDPARAADHAVAREILSDGSDRFLLDDRHLDFAAICERVVEIRSRFEADGDLADLCMRTNVPYDAWSTTTDGSLTLQLSSVALPPIPALSLPTPGSGRSIETRRMGAFEVSATDLDGKDVLVVARRARGRTTSGIRPISVRTGRLAKADVVRYVHAQTASRPLRKAAFLEELKSEGIEFPLDSARTSHVRGEEVLAVLARTGSASGLPDLPSLLPVLGTENLAAVVGDGAIEIGTFAQDGIHADDVVLVLDDACVLLTGRPEATIARLYAATSPDHCSRPVTEDECEAILEILRAVSFTPDEIAAITTVEPPSR